MLLEGRNANATRNFDMFGALSATAGLCLVVFGIVRTDTSGWGNSTTLLVIGIGLALLALFLTIEGKLAKEPLMPLRLFQSRRLTAANIIIMLVGAATFGMWFFDSLYLQDVLGYSPLKTGLIFLPMTIGVVTGSMIVSRITFRFGVKRLLIYGMCALTIGLLGLTRISVHGSSLWIMLVAGTLASTAMPFGFIPSTISAMQGVKPQEAGLASAVANTARLMGGALGLAILATLASSHSDADLRHPTAAIHTVNQALVSGFQLAFWVAAAIAALGILVAAFVMPSPQPATSTAPPVAIAVEV
jgi:predicted MFS family arabinose efflux permease